MNISTLLLLLLSFTTLYSTRADKVVLLDSRQASSELKWKTYSNVDEKEGWLEETMLSKEQTRNHHVYSTCSDNPNLESWLLIPEVESGEATRLFIEFGFTIIKCSTVPGPRSAGCKETIKLFATSLEKHHSLPEKWVNDTKWVYVSTIVANSDKNEEDVHVSSFPVVPGRKVYFSLRNTGACSSILYVKIYYLYCPATTESFVYLPRTLPGNESHSVVTVAGKCVQNASPSLNTLSSSTVPSGNTLIVTPPTSICKVDGTWQIVGASRCECNEGYIPSLKSGLCTACNINTYKAHRGTGECLLCPEHSTSTRPGSRYCDCDAGYTRDANDLVSSPCKKKRTTNGVNPDLYVLEGSSDSREDFSGEMGNNGGGDLIGTAHRYWPWVVVCLVSVLILCCILMVISRSANTSRKQMSDLDVLDNYKQDTISPDYSRSLAGQVSVLPGGVMKKKSSVPLIPAGYATHRSALGAGLLSSNRFRPYVDPTTYEDPSQALAEFTNEINPENVLVTRVIGSGEFGEVCCGRLTVEDAYGQTQHVVAVKTLSTAAALNNPKAKADFLTEASIMGQFEHENVIRLLGVVTKTEPVMIVTEYMLNGSLDQFLKQNDNGKINVYQLVEMMHGIACGMKYLTDKGYVHRDLAARNVLVDDQLTCKIADFGLSRWLSEASAGEQEYVTKNGGKIPVKWTAPEAIVFHKYTAASDVWSFGIVMWEMCSFGERPYWEWANHKVIQEVQAGYRLPIPMDTPQQLYNIMIACWQAERHKRPSFSELVGQLKSFMNEINFYLTSQQFYCV